MQSEKLCSCVAASGSPDFFVEWTRGIRAIATGTIMAAVAVLLMKAERNVVVSIRPKTIRFGVVPTKLITTSAMRRSRPQRITPPASMNAPRKRNTVSEAYGAIAALTLVTWKSGKSTIGSVEVTAIGTVSKHHQMAIQTRTPRQARPAEENCAIEPSARL